MTRSVPQISVILTSSARPTYLPRAVDSVLQQSFRNWELLIVDDGQSKDVATYLAVLEKQEPRLRVLTGAYRNVSAAANYGLSQACAPWVTFQDDDDYSHRHRLRSCWQVLAQKNEYDIVLPMVQLFYDKAGKKMETRKFTSHLKQGLLRRKLVERLGGFREIFPVAEDTDLRLRLLQAGARLYELPKVLYYYRQYDTPEHLSYRLDRAQYHLAARLSAWCCQFGHTDPVDGAHRIEDVLAHCASLPVQERMNLLQRSLLETYSWHLELAWQRADGARREAVLSHAKMSLQLCGLTPAQAEAEIRKMRMLSGAWATGIYEFIAKLGQAYQKAKGTGLPQNYDTPQALFAYCAQLAAPQRDWLVRRFLLKACKLRAYQCLASGNIRLMGRINKDVHMMLCACGYPRHQAYRMLWRFRVSAWARALRLWILRY